MKLSRFLTKAYMRGGTAIPEELDPFPLIMTRVLMNRYSLESQTLTRTCLAVIAVDGDIDIAESEIWALGNDARGLLNAFAMKRLLGKYPQAELDMFAAKLRQLQPVAD